MNIDAKDELLKIPAGNSYVTGFDIKHTQTLSWIMYVDLFESILRKQDNRKYEHMLIKYD